MSTTTERKAAATSSQERAGTETEARAGSAAGRVLRGLGSVLLLLALVLGIPVGLWITGVPLLDGELSWEKFVSVMSTPDVSGTVLLSLVTLVGWLAWATFTIAVTVELVAALRGVRAPRLRGMGVQQRVAAALVGAVVAMVLTTPAAGEAVASTQVTDPVDGASTDPVAADVLESAPTSPAPPEEAADPTDAPEPTTSAGGTEGRGTGSAPEPTASAAAGRGSAGESTTTAADAVADGTGRGADALGQEGAAAGAAEGLVDVEATKATRTRAGARADARAATSDAVTTYTVRPGDSLWRIAQETLGDGTRFKEIAHLNYGVPQSDGRALDGSHWVRPGWVLTLPGNATGAGVVRAPVQAEPGAADEVTVVPGDTLWEIAEEELGDGTQYPELYDASRTTTQPDGRRITDPDLIRPGWRITVPETEETRPGASDVVPAPERRGSEQPGNDTATGDGATGDGAASGPDGAAPEDVPDERTTGDATDENSAPDDATPDDAAPGDTPGASDTPADGPVEEPVDPDAAAGGGPADELPADGADPVGRSVGDSPEKSGSGDGGTPSADAAEEVLPPAAARGAQRADKSATNMSNGAGEQPEDTTETPAEPDHEDTTETPADPEDAGTVTPPLDTVDESDTEEPDIDEPAPPTGQGPDLPADGAAGPAAPGTPDAVAEGTGADTEGTGAGAAAGTYQEVSPQDVVADAPGAANGPELAETPSTAAPAPEGSTQDTTGTSDTAGTSDTSDAATAPRADAGQGTSDTAAPATATPAVSAVLTDAALGDELLEAFDVRTAAGVGGLLAAGLLALLAARRGSARRRRRPGERIAMPGPGTPSAELETDLRSVADDLGRAQVDIALRTLAGWHRERGLALPGVRVARLKAGEFVELYLDRAADLPAPWVSTTDRYVWQLPAGENPAVAVESATPELMESPYPSLVTLGHDDENAHLMIDLESIGCLDIRGTDDAAQATLAALAVELATSLWADDLQVTVVGVLSDLPGVVDTGRIRHVPSVAGIVRELEARAVDVDRTLAQVGAASLLEARGRGLAMDAWTPEILLVGESIALAERTRLEGLVERVPGVGIAAVTSRAEIGEWVLDLSGELTAGDTTRGVLVPAYIAVRPQQLDAATYVQALELLGEPEPVAGPAWARNIVVEEPELVAPAMLPDFSGLTRPDQQNTDVAGDVVEAPVGEKVAVEVGAGAAGHADARPAAGAAGTSVDLVAEPTTAPVTPGGPATPGGGSDWGGDDGNPWVTALGDGGSAGGPDTPEPDPATAAVVEKALQGPAEPQPAATPVVRVLGTVELAGCAGVELPASHQRQAMELVAFLAFNPGARGSDISRALWPSRDPNLATRRSAVSRARRWLGTDAYGFEYLPRYWSTDDGSQVDQEKAGYRLRGVTTDWEQFCELIGPDITETPVADLRRALDLVRGVPFQDTPPRKYVWAEVLMQEMAAGVVDVAHEVSRRALAEGDLITSREASRVGRIADPADERSWRNSIRTEYAGGRMDAAGRLIDRLRDHLEQLDMEPEPETEDLINEIDAAARLRG